MCPDVVEPEFLRHLQSLTTDLNRAVVSIGQHVVAGDLCQDLCMDGRRVGSCNQRTGVVEMLGHAFSLSLVPHEIREHQRGLCGRLAITGREEAVARFLELLCAAPVTEVAHATEAEQQLEPFGLFLWAERQRLSVVPLSRLQSVEGRGAVPRLSKRDSGSRRDRVDVAPGGAGELDGTQIVVRDHLGVVLGSAQGLDPLGCASVFLRSLDAGDLPVGDVANKQMLEGELGFAFDRAATRTLHELFLLERVELLFCRGERAEPEHLPQHGRVL